MERHYEQKIKDLQEVQTQRVQDLQRKIQQQERESQKLAEQLEFHSKKAVTSQGILERKYEQAIENEKKAKEELELVRQDRDHRLFEAQKKLQTEREEHKQMMRDIESRKSNRESNYMQDLMEFEKKEALWEAEKNNLIEAKEDAKQQQFRLEKKVDTYVQDIARLKNTIQDLQK